MLVRSFVLFLFCGHPLDAIGTHLLRCPNDGERSAAHDDLHDAVFYIIQDAHRALVRGKMGFFPSSIPMGLGGRVYLMISEPARGHTLLDVVIADPTCVDLVSRAGVVP